jgi:predicted DNA-binding transcriptional regulator AlpA
VIAHKVSNSIGNPHVAQIIKLEPRIVPRGLSREEAAHYVGISPSLFDQIVKDGRMPKPVKINSRVVWDRHELDKAFEALKDESEANPWDSLLSSGDDH